MVADIDPHVIGITELWANENIVDVELALTGYVMFRKDRRERKGGGVILNRCCGGYIKHTGNVEDYTNYKEALNLTKTEIRKCKRTFEKKLAGNIKNDSKSFYAYVRCKQKV